MSRRTHIWVRVSIVLFWALMMAWLVRYEAFPGWFAGSFAGYRSLLSEGPAVIDSWMKITFADRPIGYSHTQMDTRERSPAEQYVLENQTLLQLNIMGEPQRVSVTAGAVLDALYQLQRFNFVLFSRRYSARVEGRRIRERTYVVKLHTDAGTQSMRVEIPDDVVIYSPFVEMSMSRLKPGRELRVKTLDPISMSPVDVLVKAVGRETIVNQGREKETTVLAMNFQGMETRAWMDDAGQILRQETPLGWTMEATTPDEAMATPLGEGGEGDDLLRAAAVPCAGEITDPRNCRRLRLDLSGLSLPASEIETPRQKVVAAKPSGAELLVTAAEVPKRGIPIAAMPADLKPYLASTPFVQADHPDMVRQARSIVGRRRDSLEAARAIYDWVWRKVRKEPTVSLPSALDVLKRMEGDCNEHTYLFVGLARAAGIPAQIRIGLMYNEGAFYYHAWPAVYVGEWVEMDPTIGQPAVDATHLSLLEGEFASQLKLLGMIGKLKAEVLEQGY